MRKQSGFTLIEIAIVLVIIGLLLGGVLKGQELITSARVRNIISQQDGVKAAFYGFVDRYRAYPGDYLIASAQANIPGCGTCSGGNNNGQITANGVAGATTDEQIAVWEHLSRAGFINGSYTYGTPETTASAPSNPYARFLQLIYDTQYANAGAASRHHLKTGNQIPSDILAEVDRKVDDGLATSGSFRYSAYGGATGAPALAGPEPGTCYVAAGTWMSTSPIAECGGTSLF
jgi:prepilin-type N-terminal cleavage/methylation domain-containing protein